jgi:hypothetical protein
MKHQDLYIEFGKDRFTLHIKPMPESTNEAHLICISATLPRTYHNQHGEVTTHAEIHDLPIGFIWRTGGMKTYWDYQEITGGVILCISGNRKQAAIKLMQQWLSTSNVAKP